ncbi:Dihydroorotate dehydrogenase (NAD(+)), electron transfer subunit [hydrothermal vent metagenome]|uniref:Dihydroorotate dehydrogenase (NAD(+)), electron transfer subunit n=1 Tax=hydrothermal vent metagenome TaxID=652676 RepID=A0A3B1C5F2_9ZZZZ
MKSQRDTIFVEDAEILEHVHCDGDQHILRLRAPQVADHALPGSFIHLHCDPQRPLRRPISIMRVNSQRGEIELLYKVFGEGTRLLSQRKTGETLNLMGPIGQPFELHPERSRPLLIGGGIGMPPMIFLADAARQEKDRYAPFVILGSEVPFPFTSRPSEILISGLPDGVIASMPLLEDWHIPARLTSTQGYPGCHQGYVTDLARLWLDSLNNEERSKVEIFSCGPHPMLEAVAQMAREYDLPAQISLEEFMACGVGGCAGCVVEVQTASGPAMKRVCVDGPVFDARQVFG